MTIDMAEAFAGVLAFPQEDTPRLAYADALEECGGHPDRVEFIRLGVELGVWSGLEHPHERELLARHRLEWLGGEKCPLDFCEGGYWKHSGDHNTYPHKCPDCRGTGWACWPLAQRILPELNDQPPYDIRSHFSRGWVYKVELTWAQLFASGVAAAIWRHHPVTECVVITDTANYAMQWRKFPEKYWRRLENCPSIASERWTLSDVACEWGREQANA